MLNINNIIKEGYIPYKFSFRPISDNRAICVVKKDNEKYICVKNKEKTIDFSNIIKEYKEENTYISIFKLNWENYIHLKKFINISPKKINKKASFGTGDRTGLASSALIKSLSKYDVFPVLVQATPSEIQNTKQTYKNLILNGVMGVLESGYQGDWGADANNITEEKDLFEAINANFSMYTIDISNYIYGLNYIEENMEELAKGLNKTSLSIIDDWSNKNLFNGVKNITLNRDNLIYSACLFEQAMMKTKEFYNIIANKIPNFDFEISMNKSPRITTASDYIYCINYLQKENVKINLISPKYYGTFNPCMEYEGDTDKLYLQIQTFKSIIDILKGHKLSLHSSDKFSIYSKFKEITDHRYHIKTCGTNWLRTPILCALHNKELSFKILELVTNNDYIKYLDAEQEHVIFNNELYSILNTNYAKIINELGDELFDFIKNKEKDFYYLIEKNLDKHLLSK